MGGRTGRWLDFEGVQMEEEVLEEKVVVVWWRGWKGGTIPSQYLPFPLPFQVFWQRRLKPLKSSFGFHSNGKFPLRRLLASFHL